jgi:hypothetical protein
MIPPAPGALAVQYPPDVVLAEATKAAKALHDVIESKPNKCVIRGKTYLQFEDWQTLGRFYGVTAKAARPSTSSSARATTRCAALKPPPTRCLVSTNQVISSAEAMCLDDEEKWQDSPFFQLRSMAQTRACAKALRNVLAWVVVLAGYNPTPAEEMDGVEVTVESRARNAKGARRNPPAAELFGRSDFMQQKELFDLAHEHGRTPQDVMRIIVQCGFDQPGEVPRRSSRHPRRDREEAVTPATATFHRTRAHLSRRRPGCALGLAGPRARRHRRPARRSRYIT